MPGSLPHSELPVQRVSTPTPLEHHFVPSVSTLFVRTLRARTSSIRLRSMPTSPTSSGPAPHPVLPDALSRVSSRSISDSFRGGMARSHTPTETSSASLASRWRNHRARHTLGTRAASTHEKESLDASDTQTLICGFVKRSTGPMSLAWWSDTVTSRTRTEPGRGWRPFKAVLRGDTLYFYKVPSAMVTEVRHTFQVRSMQWPMAMLTADEWTGPDTEGLSEEAVVIEPVPIPDSSSSLAPEELGYEAITSSWTNTTKHPDLQLSQPNLMSRHWAARIESGTVAALAHELVFATQRLSSTTWQGDDLDTKSFVHLVFYALSTTQVPWHWFVRALRDYVRISNSDPASVQRVMLFVDLLLWKRPLLQTEHITLFFTELTALFSDVTDNKSAAYAPLHAQVTAWKEHSTDETASHATNWLNGSPRNRGVRTDLAPLRTCWSAALLVKQDASEIARQIQSFHADRLRAFLRVPITAYRLGSSVTEPWLRSFRFDASKPHWLTHVILRQLLVDAAPERQGEAASVSRAHVLTQWIQVASYLQRYSDMAGWVAVCAALCSRAVAALDGLWRDVPMPLQTLVTEQWAPRLASHGWLEGVHTSIDPIWAWDEANNRAGILSEVPGAIPYLGNAGLLSPAAIVTANEFVSAVTPTARIRIPLAAQESEFHRVRALAQQLLSSYERDPPMPMSPAPIAEYQALFQRLSTYEFILQTSVTDYMGNAVVVDGRVVERVHVDEPAAWPTRAVADGAVLFSFPAAFPTLTPGHQSADAIVSRRAFLLDDTPGRAYASLARCAARFVSQAEEVRMSDDLVLYPMHARIAGLDDSSRGSSSATASPWTGPPQVHTYAPERRFPVEIRAATVPRLLDILVLSTEHLVVRAQAEPRTDPPTYDLLHVDLKWTAYRDTLLLSYRGWITAKALLDALIHRWTMAESAAREMAWHTRMNVPNQFPSWAPLQGASFQREPIEEARLHAIRWRVLDSIRRWLELYPREWISDLVLYEALHTFLKSAAEQCDAIASDTMPLSEAVQGLLAMLPTLPTRSITSMGMDCAVLPSLVPTIDVPRAFDWERPAQELVVYFESMLAPPYAMLHAHDLAQAAWTLEQMHDTRSAWLSAATADPSQCMSMYRLLRCLPPSQQYGHVPEGSALWDTLPPSLRELCRVHEIVRDWTEAQVTEPRIGMERRVERINRLIDAVLLSRASMARAMRLATPDNPGTRAPLPPTFLECAVLEGLTTSRAQTFRAAWEYVTTTRNVAAWADLLGSTPTTLPDGLPHCTPDPGWILSVLAHWGIRPKARAQTPVLLEFSRYMSASDLVADALAFHTGAPTEHAINVARVRLDWLRSWTNNASWPHALMLEDAALEATFQGIPATGPLVFFAGVILAQERKRVELEEAHRHGTETPTAEAPRLDTQALATALENEADVTIDAEAQSTIHTSATSMTCASAASAHESDSLLQAVPTSRPSTVVCCAGALITVWPYQKHPFVLHMATPQGDKCTLKFPNYDEFGHWLTQLQTLPHVRMADSFDAGTYAADVADYLGRASAASVFGVPLRELSLRTQGAVLPPTIERVLQEIEARGLLEQGIYRISGTRHAVEQLQHMLETKPPQQLMLSRIDVHVLASVVKLWLRELPEPIVPYAFYERLMETERIALQEQRVKAIRKLVHLFPRCHYLALQRMAHHLAMVANASKANLMAAHNIGLVFGSTLLHPPPGPGSVANGLDNLGRAAHIVKIMVVMHRQLFLPWHRT